MAKRKSKEFKSVYWFALKKKHPTSFGGQKHPPFIRALVKIRDLNGLKIWLSSVNLCRQAKCWIGRVTRYQDPMLRCNIIETKKDRNAATRVTCVTAMWECEFGLNLSGSELTCFQFSYSQEPWEIIHNFSFRDFISSPIAVYIQMIIWTGVLKHQDLWK